MRVTLARERNIETQDVLQVGNAERGERDLFVAKLNADEWATRGYISPWAGLVRETIVILTIVRLTDAAVRSKRKAAKEKYSGTRALPMYHRLGYMQNRNATDWSVTYR